MVFCSLLEAASISAVVPFIGLLSGNAELTDKVSSLPLVGPVLTRENSDFLIVTVIFVLSLLLSSFVRLAVLIFQIRVTYAIGSEASIDMFRQSLSKRYEDFISENSSEAMSGVITKSNSLIGECIFPTLNILLALFVASSVMATLIYLDPVIASVLFLFLFVIYGAISLSTLGILRVLSARIDSELNRLMRFLKEGLGSFKQIILDDSRDYFVRRFEDSELPLRRSLASVQIFSSGPRFLVEALSISCIAVFAYVFSTGKDIGITITMLGAFALAGQKLMPLFNLAYAGLTALRGGQYVVSSALDLLEIRRDSISRSDESVMGLERDICLSSVSYRYPNSDYLCLKNVELLIKKGDRVGIVGETGSGKSTLIDILMGLIKPSVGSLRVDGVDIDQSNRAAWQRSVGHVPQEIYLIDGSVADNVAISRPDIPIDVLRVERALNQARFFVGDFNFSKLLNVGVGDNGATLSGGQKQRIAIARALYKGSSFLVLDEATSALDENTESSLLEALGRLNSDVTLVLVTHRRKVLEMCSKVYRLRAGSLIEVTDKDEF
jgi:ABC-type bacteriocin/lantibiotic exporter with double-glycine peptidase domain